MNFLSIDWADSDIERIIIEYNIASLLIRNHTLSKELIVECTGLAGITNVCIWDDTIIMNAEIHTEWDDNNAFLHNLYLSYDKDYDYGGRSLSKGLVELRIELSNYTCFSIYCQNIDVWDKDGGRFETKTGDGSLS